MLAARKKHIVVNLLSSRNRYSDLSQVGPSRYLMHSVSVRYLARRFFCLRAALLIFIWFSI